MKKKLFIFAGSLLLSASLAYGQSDSTRSSTGSQGATGSTPRQGTTSQGYGTQPTQSGSQQDQSQTYRTETMTTVQQDALPSELRQTLRDDQRYQGWENATFYRDPATGDYIVQMNSTSTGTTGTSGTMGSTGTTGTTGTSGTTGTTGTTGTSGTTGTTSSDGTTQSQPVFYRFDRNGKAIEENDDDN